MEIMPASPYNILNKPFFHNPIGERSGRVLDLRPRGRGMEPHPPPLRCVLEQDTLILALIVKLYECLRDL